MTRVIYIFVFLVIVFTYLTIQESSDKEKDVQTLADYYKHLPSGILRIIKSIDTETLQTKIEFDGDYIVDDLLILFKNDNNIKLYKDIAINVDTLSSVDTTKIETVILIEIQDTKVSTYQNGADAIRTDYRLTFIKYPEKIVYFEKALEGSEPPTSIKRRPGQDFGARGRAPLHESVIEYISNRKRKINHNGT